jgi:hypothetical protein
MMFEHIIRYKDDAFVVRESIVRCRDCKHFTRDATPHDAAFPDWCSKLGTDYVQPDGFCAWGERRPDHGRR